MFLKARLKTWRVKKNLIIICTLFVLVAKINENYTNKEKLIFLKALSDIFDKKESNLKIVFKEAKKKKIGSIKFLNLLKR